MSKVNEIQKEILQMEGGAFQKLIEMYLMKKYHFSNIQTLGSETGTNKTTKGTPDSYVLTDENKYILICCGSVKNDPEKKITTDIMSCYNKGKLELEEKRIAKIICAHTSTNIHIEQLESIRDLIKGIDIELIGIDTLSYELNLLFPKIAYEYLGVSVDTHQFFEIEDFIKVYDKCGINSPLDVKFQFREKEIDVLKQTVSDYPVTIVTGASGIGKTRLVIELCKYYRDNAWTVYCVKNNGELLYNDLADYLSDSGRYLLFFDDANNATSFNYVLDYINDLPNDKEVKIILTVRDYAKSVVVNLVNKIFKYKETNISGFSNDEIQKILTDNIGIINQNYLEQIIKISNGNIRLAMLAGMRAIDGGYFAIRNSEDIFKTYYGDIVDKSDLDKEDILYLFVIAYLGPLRYKNNDFYKSIKDSLSIEKKEEDVFEKLYSLELIDWFKKEIVKISDQSMGNYIVYYVLIDKKWITINKLIKDGFPQNRKRIISILSMLVNLFASEENLEYIKSEINEAWEEAPKEYTWEYLKCFHNVNEERTLCEIKKHIDSDKKKEFNLLDYDINKYKNYQNITSDVIEILSGFKYSSLFVDAVELLLFYFGKRPDLVMDFYFAFSKNMWFDKYSYDCKYINEYKLLELLWGSTKNGLVYNNSLLFIHVADQALNCEVEYFEGSEGNTINFVRQTIVVCEEIKKIRLFIWEKIAILYKNTLYSSKLRGFVKFDHLRGLEEEQFEELLVFDFDCFNKFFIDDKKTLDFYDCVQLGRFSGWAGTNILEKDVRMRRVNECFEYQVYDVFTKDHIMGNTLEEDEAERKEEIKQFISIYSIEEYCKIIRALSFLESRCSDSNWQISSGIDVLFEILEEDVEIYKNVLEVYLQHGAPYFKSLHRIVPYSLKQFGYKYCFDLIDKSSDSNKDIFLMEVWINIPDKEIDVNLTKGFKEYLINNIPGNEQCVPTVYEIEKYNKYDEKFVFDISELVVNDKNKSVHFLSNYLSDAHVEILKRLFDDRINLLEELYFSALNQHFDYEAKLFTYLYDSNYHVWERYILWFKDNKNHSEYSNHIFEIIWKDSEYEERIRYAYEVLAADYYGWIGIDGVTAIFANTDRTSEFIRKRKKEWIKKYIIENIEITENIKKIINIVYDIFPSWKKEIILFLIDNNYNIDDFKKINLLPNHSSWSGSEIPIINNNISYLQDLMNSLSGAKYIEHKKYIKDEILYQEKHRKDVELREYMQDFY